MRKLLCIHIGIFIAFLANALVPVSSVFAQAHPAYSYSGARPANSGDFHLPVPGVMVHLSPPFAPPILKGIKVHPENPFRFDFILDKGDVSFNSPSLREGNQDRLKQEATRLIKYFLASLTIPEKDLWVNLSPYEKDRIIPQSFGLTEMGRDLLAEDYILKQITASLIYPEDTIGKKFWRRIYQESAKRYGTTNVPVNTFNKVWIVPEKALVYENAKIGAAYVVESKLKVMLEQDYLSLQKHEGVQMKVASLGSQIVREIVIPELTKEVNANKNFARLRQVYNSLILATWYKKKIKDSILTQVYADKNKVAGINIHDPQEKQRIYARYLRAFKKGVFNYIKDETISGSEMSSKEQGILPRKYFSGGAFLDLNDTNLKTMARLNIVRDIPSIAMLGEDRALNANVVIKEDAENSAVRSFESPSDARLRVKINILDDSISSGLIKRILSVASYQDMSRTISGRSLIINLGKKNQITSRGHIFNTIRLKGITNQGALPEARAYISGKNSMISQSTTYLEIVPMFGREVITYPSSEPTPLGTMLLEFAIREYELMKSAFEAGVSTALPIGYGELVGKEFNGKKMGFVILAEENESTQRLGSRLRSIFIYQASMYSSQLEQDILRTAKVLRSLHQAGFTHGQPHLDQFDSKGNIYDFETAYNARNEISRDEFIYRVIYDFSSFYKAVQTQAIYSNNSRLVYSNVLNGYFLDNKELIDTIKEEDKSSEYLISLCNSLFEVAILDGRGLKDTIDKFKEKNAVVAVLVRLAGQWYDQANNLKEIKNAAMRVKANNPILDKTNRRQGGIDLTLANNVLQTKNANGEIKFHLDPAMLQRLQNATGFVPVVMSIEHVDLRGFLGLSVHESPA